MIDRWTKEINKMRNSILAWGTGVNSQEVGATFWERNKTKCYTFMLFSGMGLLFYGLGWIGLVRVCGLILGLQVLSWVWSWFKK